MLPLEDYLLRPKVEFWRVGAFWSWSLGRWLVNSVDTTQSFLIGIEHADKSINANLSCIVDEVIQGTYPILAVLEKSLNIPYLIKRINKSDAGLFIGFAVQRGTESHCAFITRRIVFAFPVFVASLFASTLTVDGCACKHWTT